MESQESLALMWLLRTVVAIALLPLALCLAGLLWAPIGASIAALYARYKIIPAGNAASTAALASVHMLVPWAYVMLNISNQRRRPVLERAIHIGTHALWLLGPILFLACLGCFGTVASIVERLNIPAGWPKGDNVIFALTVIASVAMVVMATLGALLWYRSLRLVGSETQSEGQGGLWLPVRVAHSIRMTILWSAGSVVLSVVMLFIGLSAIGRE